MMEELSCGCIRGEYLCLEAVALWTAVNLAYEKWRITDGCDDCWNEYRNTMKKYREHYEQD
jgi:hypothetical protein